MLFRLLSGGHCADIVTVLPNGRKKRIPTYYSKGDVVQSESDLVERFGKEKFARVHEEVAAKTPKKKLTKKKGSDGDSDDSGEG